MLEAPVKEILRCQRAQAARHWQAAQVELLTVNTIRSALGADPIDLSPDTVPSETDQEAAQALAERFEQMQQSTHQ